MCGWVLCCFVGVFFPHFLFISFYIDQLTNPLHSGIMSRMREHTNKPPHPTQVLQPWFMLELCHNTLFYDTANLI